MSCTVSVSVTVLHSKSVTRVQCLCQCFIVQVQDSSNIVQLDQFIPQEFIMYLSKALFNNRIIPWRSAISTIISGVSLSVSNSKLSVSFSMLEFTVLKAFQLQN
jgi:hypothetical protein